MPCMKSIHAERFQRQLQIEDHHAILRGLISWLVELTEHRVSRRISKVRSGLKFRHVEHARPHKDVVRPSDVLT